jgi:hypothetical protein
MNGLGKYGGVISYQKGIQYFVEGHILLKTQK